MFQTELSIQGRHDRLDLPGTQIEYVRAWLPANRTAATHELRACWHTSALEPKGFAGHEQTISRLIDQSTVTSVFQLAASQPSQAEWMT